MSLKSSERDSVTSVLFISLSNIGDVVLTFPVFDALCEAFPQALFTVVVSPKGQEFFEGNPRVKKVRVLDKSQGLVDKWQWLCGLREEAFDLVVDLRNSMLPFLVRARLRTLPAVAPAKVHMREKHLDRLRAVFDDDAARLPATRERHLLHWAAEQERIAEALLMGQTGFAVVAPGAADDRKRWSCAGFVEAVRWLVNEAGVPVVVVGDRRDEKTAQEIFRSASPGVLNICGWTSLKALMFVLSRARLALVNDSGIMHLASYLDVPTVALFGPTDPALYGPWGRGAAVVRSPSGLMQDIKAPDVIAALGKVL